MNITEGNQLVTFNALYHDCRDGFVRFANSYVRDGAIAEDITTETLIHYWENRATLADNTNVPAYLLTIIKNKCLNHLRHLQVREEYDEAIRSYTQWELNSRIAGLQACEPNEFFCTEIETIVQQTLAQLPERTRTIFTLNRFEQKTYKEIALLMGITPKGVDFHITKALKALHTNLKDYFPTYLVFFLHYH